MTHHYRTRSTTRTGTTTSSAKTESKRIAKNDNLDAFNNIPSSVIEHILCFMPTKDAVRTSILSKSWRYCWTKIPKLEFDLEYMVKLQMEEQLFADWSSETKELMMRCKGFLAIHQVLLMHQAPILDFTVSVMEPDDDICVEIEQLITQLARRTNNTVKKFTFEIFSRDYTDYSFYELPRSIFLLRHLTDLHIENCTLNNLAPTLNEFGSLTRLYLLGGSFSAKPLLHLLASCPRLEKLELLLHPVRSAHHLKIIELFKCLPVRIEDLTINENMVEDVPRELPVALVHLKRFCLSDMMLLDGYGLEFLFLVIRSSPNLEKIELHIEQLEKDENEMYGAYQYTSDALKDSADIWLEHLKELKIIDFAYLEHEMEFMKLILMRAPMLKKVRIFHDCSTSRTTSRTVRDEGLKILRNFLHSSPCVSSLAEIIDEGTCFCCTET